MAGVTNQKGHLLQVRSNKLVGITGSDITEAKGTSDRMPLSSAGSDADRMPMAKGYFEQHSDQPKIISEHYSWKALQGSEVPGGQWSGVLSGELDQMGSHQPMAGVVPKNKPPF